MPRLTKDILTFASPVILVGAAPVPIDATLRGLPDSWPLLAADGGAVVALELGRIPQAVIGDMDSLDPSVILPDGVTKLHISSQDDTDFEKCLSRINAPLILGLGFLGARFDHSLAAMHALMCLRHERPVMLAGTSDVVLRVRGDFAASLPLGSRFSIWPLGKQSFASSNGLRWSLDGLTMGAGNLIGTSNEVVAETVSIRAGPGDGYAVIVPLAELPEMLAAIDVPLT